MVKIRRGLFIGINYTGTKFSLRGCINDQENLTEFLIKKNFLEQKDLILMNDFQKASLYPTKVNILKQIDNLAEFCFNNKKEEILLVLAYSGHGSYITDKSGDELDKKDEVICPIDCDINGFITDDILKRNLIERLGSNVKLVILMDCCHSGSIFDLKYNYAIDDKDTCTVYGNCKENKCNVVMISGCLDKQTSADAYIKDKRRYEFQGAMTASFIKNYDEKISYKKLIEKMRTFLQDSKYEQIPQLATSFPIKTNEEFLLNSYYKKHDPE